MTAKDLAEKILSRIGNYNLADPTYGPDLKEVESLLSAALEEVYKVGHDDAEMKGLEMAVKRCNEAKAAVYEDAAKIADEWAHVSGDSYGLGGKLRAKAGEVK